MDYFLSEEQLELQKLTRKIAQEKVKPVAAQFDQSGEFPWDFGCSLKRNSVGSEVVCWIFPS